MLEYFTYKKVKKHQAEKRALAEMHSPVLSQEDENFLERIVSAEGTPPALPDRPHYLNNPVVGDSTASEAQVVVHDPASENQHHGKDKGKGKETITSDTTKEKKKSNRFSFLHRSNTKKGDGLEPNAKVPIAEAAKEENDINRILDDLNLAAVNNRAFSLSKESQIMVQKFTVILKDLVNGVPTAYDDLVNLIEDSQGTLAKSYDHLPSYLQKLITTLPSKLTSTLAPELLAVATEAQAFTGASAGAAGAAGAGGLAGAAKSFFTPSTLKNLVTKPGAVAGLLKTIMNALKLRWPAFMGTNVLLSLGLFVLLFVFWYCHKRGKEVRLERERTVDSNGRIVELEDDPMLPGPSAPALSGPERPTVYGSVLEQGHKTKHTSTRRTSKLAPGRESDERRRR